MKKIATIIVALFALFTLAACGTESTAYKYADQFDLGEIESLEGLAQYVQKYETPEVSDTDLEFLESIKELVKENIAHSELLDWDKFDRLQTVHRLDIPVEDVENMSYEEIYIYSSYLAFYDETSDSVYLLPQFYAAEEDQKLYAMIHEVIHSLVDNRDDPDDNRLVEGAVDWLAYKLCNAVDIQATPAYQESIYCLRILMDIYGETETLRAVCEDRIVDLIDGSTEPGMTEKLSYALSIAHGGIDGDKEKIRDAVYVELDIIAHAAKHEGVDIGDWLDAAKALYASNGIELDVRYFKK